MARGNRNKSKSENGDKGKGNWKVSPKNLLGEGNHLKLNGISVCYHKIVISV